MSSSPSVRALIKYVILKVNREVTNLLSRNIICSIFSSVANESFQYKLVVFKCCIVFSYVILSLDVLKTQPKD